MALCQSIEMPPKRSLLPQKDHSQHKIPSFNHERWNAPYFLLQWFLKGLALFLTQHLIYIHIVWIEMNTIAVGICYNMRSLSCYSMYVWPLFLWGQRYLHTNYIRSAAILVLVKKGIAVWLSPNVSISQETSILRSKLF